MRQIKCRAWDKKKNKFSKPFGFGDLIGYEGEGGAYVHTDDLDIVINRKLNKDLIFQQYTGLKDKHNKDIYEGDIIRFMGKWDEKGKVLDPDYLPYEVVWIMGGFRAFLVKRNKAMSIHKHNEILGVGHTDSEIIGNVFENPELLN